MRAFVGLDLGATGIRGIQVSGKGGEFTISRSAEVLLPAGSVINGRIIDRTLITSALKKLWRQGKFTTRNVYFGISDLNIGDEDAYFTASEALIDARLFPIGAGAQRDALTRASQIAGDHGTLTLIVNIGSDDLTLVGHLGDLQLFSSTQPTLGTDLALLALTNGLGLERTEASQLFFDHGVALDPVNPAYVLIKSWQDTLLDAIHDGAERLSANGYVVEEVVLAGSGFRVPQLMATISQRIQLPVHLLGAQPSLAIATGLAVTSSESDDLLPAPVHEAVVLLRIKKWIIAAFVVLGISSLAYWMYQQRQLNDLWDQVALLRAGSK